MKITARQQETIDMLCYRYYGKTSGVTEAVLNANPGIADIGVFLPHGHTVDMPEQVTPASTDTLQLWD